MRLQQQILDLKDNKGLLDGNFIAICYEGPFVGSLTIDDIDELIITMEKGDIIILPKSSEVINSIKNGVLSYFLNYRPVDDTPTVLSLYKFKEILA